MQVTTSDGEVDEPVPYTDVLPSDPVEDTPVAVPALVADAEDPESVVEVKVERDDVELDEEAVREDVEEEVEELSVGFPEVADDEVEDSDEVDVAEVSVED